MISYPYTLIVDIPLAFFNNVNKTSQGNVLVGNDGCVSTLTGIKAMIFSGANALARKRFTMTTIRTSTSYPSRSSRSTSGIRVNRCSSGRGVLLRLTTRARRFAARPVKTTLHATFPRRTASNYRIASMRRVTKRNVHTGIGNGIIYINGGGVVRGVNTG